MWNLSTVLGLSFEGREREKMMERQSERMMIDSKAEDEVIISRMRVWSWSQSGMNQAREESLSSFTLSSTFLAITFLSWVPEMMVTMMMMMMTITQKFWVNHNGYYSTSVLHLQSLLSCIRRKASRKLSSCPFLFTGFSFFAALVAFSAKEPLVEILVRIPFPSELIIHPLRMDNQASIEDTQLLNRVCQTNSGSWLQTLV